jgi:hypothetical protein
VRKPERAEVVAIRPSKFGQMFDFSDSAVYSLIQREVPSIRFGRSIRIPVAAIDKILTAVGSQADTTELKSVTE